MSSSLKTQNKLFYGWVVVIALVVISTITQGSINSFGVFFRSIENEFELTRTATSMVFSIAMVFGCVVTFAGGWALDKYGPRIVTFLMGIFTGLGLLLSSQTNAPWQLFITYSLLLSLGTRATYTVVMATVLRWFDKNRGLALGIGGSGLALGTVLIAPFATYLISSFDWRVAFIALGLITWLLVTPLSRLLRKSPYEIGALPNGKISGSGEKGIEKREVGGRTQPAGHSLQQAFRTRSFWLFGSIRLMRAFCLFLVITHIVPHATDVGIPAIEAATILSLIGVSIITGRIIIGRVSDNIGSKTTAITCSLILAGAMIWLIWSRDLWMFYIFGVAYGFSRGGFDPPMTALVSDIFGLRSIGVIMGALNVAWGIGSAVGPAVGGLIFDVSNNYSVAFLAGAIAVLISAVFIALIRQETTGYVDKELG
ncbi:MFS transporter [Chloroflexota bacterium]